MVGVDVFIIFFWVFCVKLIMFNNSDLMICLVEIIGVYCVDNVIIYDYNLICFGWY